jgi:hypothetical protein
MEVQMMVKLIILVSVFVAFLIVVALVEHYLGANDQDHPAR